MYERKSESDHEVKWNPQDKEAAKRAMDEIVGEINTEVGKDTAEEIRERYQELVESEDT